MISRGRNQKTKTLNLVTKDWFLGGIELHFHLLDGEKKTLPTVHQLNLFSFRTRAFVSLIIRE